MKLITVGQLIKTLNSQQYIEIFSANRKTMDIETGLYKVNEVPSKLLDLYVAYIASGTSENLQVRPKNDIKSVLLIDAYNTKKEALKIIEQIQSSCKDDAEML